ncbi:glutathione peroxidase [Jatrophihabitans sp.]|uniref:glutathione peroxidase n=1 Tax=Jatrophihabitans sp. TaxID=1932789 RepID=UPI0030C74450|nr:btuE [Jatrophihabitans sp.]
MTTALQSVPIDTISGEPTSLAEYAGRVLLVVNVASKCGLTPQYEGLEALYERFNGQGLEVLGFPANDFREQEPGTNEEILEFCQATYAVKFPIFAKIAVTGEDKHPLYELLTEAVPHASGDPEAHRERLRGFGIPANDDPDILWNFEKFLIGRDGTVLARFAPNLVPEDPALVGAIEDALAS